MMVKGKKRFMYKCIVKSLYGVRTMYMCSDKKALETFIGNNFSRFEIGEIAKSQRYFCTDGNKEIHTISLN